MHIKKDELGKPSVKTPSLMQFDFMCTNVLPRL